MTNLGQILVNPQPFVDATRLWISSHAVLLTGSALGFLAVSGLVGFGIGGWRDRRRERRRMAAAFGGKSDAKAAELLNNCDLAYSGIPIGKLGNKRLCWGGQEPLLVTGGTRSGKGVGVIRPAMLTYGGPIVAYDGGKGELFADTSGWRSTFSRIINLNFADPNGAHFNFLDEIDMSNPVAGADNLVQQIPSPGGDGHFEAASNRFISGCILHVLHAGIESERNMGGVVRLISKGDAGSMSILQEAVHPVAVDRVRGLYGGDPLGDATNAADDSKYRMLIYNDALVRLSAFEEPVTAEITSRSDFRLSDLICPDDQGHPTTLYLTTPANNDARLKPVVAMLFGMLINEILTDRFKASDGRLKGERMLLVIDEFPSLRLKTIETAMTKIIGYGCTMLLGAQSLNALKEYPYGPNNQIRDNVRVHVAFAANDATSQREISQSVGQIDEQRKSVSRRPWSGGGKTETESTARRAILDPGDVRALPDHLEVVLVTGHKPILAYKLRDYRDKILKARMLPPAVPPVAQPAPSVVVASPVAASLPSPRSKVRKKLIAAP